MSEAFYLLHITKFSIDTKIAVLKSFVFLICGKILTKDLIELTRPVMLV
jgi:hypothetical protein